MFENFQYFIKSFILGVKGGLQGFYEEWLSKKNVSSISSLKKSTGEAISFRIEKI